jgi:uncharacterized repeat protein (TIGR03803 family)
MVGLGGARTFGCAIVLAALVSANSVWAAGKETVLYSFKNNGADGNIPAGDLLNVNGTLYGTTQNGGTSNIGTVFSINPFTGAETVLYSFQNNGEDGTYPAAGLIDVDSTLYGTTQFGGASDVGTVFSIDPSTGAEKVVYAFQNNGVDGAVPTDDLIDVDGTLYGTTNYGGDVSGDGTIFSIDLSTGVESVLHAFDSEDQDGVSPAAALLDVDGALYGTAQDGGEFGHGVVFSFDLSTDAYAVVYSFQNNGDGGYPDSSLIDVDGALYGTTSAGGSQCGCGTVFSVNPTRGSESVLYAFGTGGGDGAGPLAGLIDIRGKLYGTTERGGAGGVPGCGGKGCGTVFAVDIKTGAEKVLRSFDDEDGTLPFAALIAVRKGLYGTTVGGGAQGRGTVFKIEP